METRRPCRPTRGSLTSPSYLARNRTLGPPLENNPEIPPSSRDEGLRLLHDLETNLARNSTVLNKNNSQTGVWILKSVWGYILISRNCCSKSWHLPKNIHGNHSGKANFRGNVRRKTRKWKITFYWSGNTSNWARYTTNSHMTAA